MKKIAIALVLGTLIFSCKPKEIEKIVEEPTITNVAVIQGVYNAFAAGDMDSFFAALDDNVVWNEAENFTYADKSPYIGKEAIANDLLGRIGADWDNFDVVDPIIYNMDNDMVMVTARYQGTLKVSGNTVDAQLGHLFWLKNGKVIKFQQFTDTKQFADATASNE